MFKKSLKLHFPWILGMASGPKKVAPGSLQNIRTGGHFFCYFGSWSIMAYGKAWQSHTHTVQQTRTHKAVTRRIEAKKLLFRRRQSNYSSILLNDGQLATFTNSPQVYKLAPLQSRHINANLSKIHTRPTFSCNALWVSSLNERSVL